MCRIVKLMVELDSSLVNYAAESGVCLLVCAASHNCVQVADFLLSQVKGDA